MHEVERRMEQLLRVRVGVYAVSDTKHPERFDIAQRERTEENKMSA
jgi:hypothetical protein